MERKSGVVETHVDKLMLLLQREQYISVAKAAEQLQVSVEIIEEWARLLEEEKILQIKYQLTTPYLQYVGHPKKKIAPIAVEEPTQTHPQKVQRTELEIAVDEFKKTHEAYNKLPASFLTEKHKLENELMRLHRKVSGSIDVSHAQQFSAGSKIITDLLKQGSGYLRNQAVEQAIQVYNLIKKTYSDLPPGFNEQKQVLTHTIVDYYKKLSLAQHQAVKSIMLKKSAIISQGITNINLLLTERRVDEAHSEYEKLRTTYGEIPPGFLEEKISLQEEMLKVYRQILLQERETSLSSIQKTTLSINDAVASIEQQLRLGKIAEAVAGYNEVQQMYAKLPEGFLENETAIQQRVLDVYGKILQFKHGLALTSSKQYSIVLKKHLTKVDHYSLKGHHQMAFEHYKEAVKAYNTFPSGYAREKVTFRDQIYERYYNLIAQSDVVTLQSLEPYVKSKYYHLLELIVTVHKVIDAKEFDLLQEIYASVYTAYHELPLHVIKSNSLIIREVHNVAALVSLYQSTQTLEQLAEQNKLKELQEQLASIDVQYKTVEMHSPEDKELLDYIMGIRNRYSQYVSNSVLHSARPPQPTTPNKEHVINSLVMAKKEKALQAIANNNHAEAIPHLRTVLELNPQDMESRYMLENIQKKL